MQFQMAFVRTLQIPETMLWVPRAGLREARDQ